MKAVYLASQVTLPGSPNRRQDAFEHDLMMACLRPAFEARGAMIDDFAWDDDQVDWTAYDGVMIGTTWDYWDRHNEFLATLDKISTQTTLFNPPNLVRWNSHKYYLKDIAEKDVAIIPTVWIETPTQEAIDDAFSQLNTDDIVIKRQVGANAEGQFRLKRGDAVPEIPHTMMAQPFMPSIASEGEYSFIFINGAFCHCVLKCAKDGDYRIQSDYGGTNAAIEPTDKDIAAARRVVEALNDVPLYARVDMVRGNDNDLLLMEIEMIEPFLYPLEGPELGQRIYDAMTKLI